MAFKGLDARSQAAFKNQVERFAAKEAKEYSTPSASDISPNDASRYDRVHDTYRLPLGSIKRDFSRMTKFLKSPDGVKFLLNQELLQTGNAIAETRVINPLFVVANTQPYKHFARSLSNPSQFQFSGNASDLAPDSLNVRIGHAGRMQKSTRNAALARVSGNVGVSGLLGLLPTSSLIKSILGTLSLVSDGATGQDQRPELDVDGEFYATQLWKNYRRTLPPQDYLTRAASDLRTGNVRGAINDVRGAAGSVKNILSGAKNKVTGAYDKVRGYASIATHGQTTTSSDTHYNESQRGDPHNTKINGLRYAVTGKASLDAERYLVGSVDADGNPNLRWLDRRPYIPSVSSAVGGVTSKSLTQQVNDSKRLIGNAQSAVRGKIKNAAKTALTTAIRNTNPTVATGLFVGAIVATASDPEKKNNPAETVHMRFPELSLAARLKAIQDTDDIQKALTAQIKSGIAYNASQYDDALSTKLGFGRGRIGSTVSGEPRFAGTYGTDNINSAVLSTLNHRPNEITPDAFAAIQATAKDYIDVLFFDYSNKNAIPFRALISNINQNINPEFTDRRYIGRNERNVVYTGATRNVSFSLNIRAMSRDELLNVWGKIDTLTSLTFPAQYLDGVMVPPFVKLTIGNLYRNTPGYISSLSMMVEDGTPWEMDDDEQLPHGVVLNVGFSIIEKSIMTAKDVVTTNSFYGLGARRLTPIEPSTK